MVAAGRVVWSHGQNWGSDAMDQEFLLHPLLRLYNPKHAQPLPSQCPFCERQVSLQGGEAFLAPGRGLTGTRLPDTHGKNAWHGLPAQACQELAGQLAVPASRCAGEETAPIQCCHTVARAGQAAPGLALLCVSAGLDPFCAVHSGGLSGPRPPSSRPTLPRRTFIYLSTGLGVKRTLGTFFSPRWNNRSQTKVSVAYGH